MKFILIKIIRLYSWLISPLMVQSCRFHPSCSAYSIEAIEIHGVFKGIMLTIRRISKCHPWHNGDYIDYVPPLNAKNQDNKPKDCQH